MEQSVALFGKATFAMDRGYDDSKMFLKLEELKQDYVLRLTSKRKLFFHNNWFLQRNCAICGKAKLKQMGFTGGKTMKPIFPM